MGMPDGAPHQWMPKGPISDFIRDFLKEWWGLMSCENLG
jgi:hypothetical protein